MNSKLTFDRDKDISPLGAKRILLCIIILAAVLRLWGIWHGYPYSYYPDEAHFVKRALSFGSGDFNPHWFHKPAFYMYLLFFEYGLFFLIGKIVGFWHSVTDFGIYYIKNPGPFYLIGRITTSMFSIGSIIFAYLAAKQLFNRKVGLISALLLSLSFGHVMVAKDVKADTPCMFFTIVSAYFLVCYMKNRRMKNVILSCIFAGIGTATKYYSIVMLIPIFFALFSDIRRHNVKTITHGLKTFLVCLLSFYFIYFACSPYNFIDPLGRKSTFGGVHSLVNKVSSVFAGSEEESQLTKKNISQNTHSPEISFTVYKEGLIDYVAELYKGTGLVIILMLFFGVIYIFKNLNQSILAFLIFPGLFVMISIFLSPGYPEIRHQIVIYPFLTICGALFCTKLLDFAHNYNRFGYALILILLIPMYHIPIYDIFISKADTRHMAKKWIETNIPAGRKILIEDGELKLSPGKEYFEKMLERARKTDKNQFTFHAEKYYSLLLKAMPEKTYDITYIRFPWWQQKEERPGLYFATAEHDIDMGNPLKPVGVMPYEYYKKNGYQYVITSSEKYLNFRDGSELARNFPSFYSFYKKIFEQGVLIREFNPNSGSRPGPIIRIFELS